MKRFAAAMAIAVASGAVGAGTALAAAGFSDVPDSSPFVSDIQFVRDAGITTGCGDGTRYCPGDVVRRDTMAAFLHRLSGNDPDVPPSVNALSLDGFSAGSFSIGTVTVEASYTGGVGFAFCPAGTTVVSGGFEQMDFPQVNIPVIDYAVDSGPGEDYWLVATANPATGMARGTGTVQVTCTVYAGSGVSSAQAQEPPSQAELEQIYADVMAR